MAKIIQFPKLPTKPATNKSELLVLANGAVDLLKLLEKRAVLIKNPVTDSNYHLLSDYLNFANIVFAQLAQIAPKLEIESSEVPRHLEEIISQAHDLISKRELNVAYFQSLISAIVSEIHNLVLKVADDE